MDSYNDFSDAKVGFSTIVKDGSALVTFTKIGDYEFCVTSHYSYCVDDCVTLSTVMVPMAASKLYDFLMNKKF